MTSRSAGNRLRPGRRRLWSDSKLIGACIDGDADAWSELLDRYSGLVYSVALQVGLRQDDASDVVQNVSMIVLDRLGDLRSTDRIASWLITVTRREALRVLRRNQCRSGQMPAGDITEAGAGVDGEPEDMAARLVALQDQQCVREALTRLPPRCREMIEMLFISDPPASYAEVAAELGMSVGSVGPIRARCLERLRKLLDEVGF